jgi:tetratricopeptide (TPR) repeat protein/tRNA A-37 threonylcarbamoyl transferase component Bud32
VRCDYCGSEQIASSEPCTVCGRARMSGVAVSEGLPTGYPSDETRLGDPIATTGAGSAPLAVGQVFASRYHILRRLGAGGMGIVYQAFDTELGVPVALKVIRPEVLESPEQAAEIERRFKRELVLARQVTHKNVVRIHDLGDAGGVKYLTMPFIEGEDLAKVLKRRGKLPVEETVAILRQVAHGLAAAHEVGVVHRDLKPENIMLSADGAALITDFGIARSMSGTATATALGAVLGTLEYMAPEQAQGLAIDQRADIYAFGLIGYDALTGRQRLARRENPMSEMMARIQSTPAPLKTLDASIPDALEQVVARCLQPAADARFQTSAEMTAALDALTPQGHALTAPAAARRSRLLPIALVISVLSASIAMWAIWRGRPAAGPAAAIKPVSILIANFDNRAGDPLLDGLVEQALGIGVEGASFVNAYPRREAVRAAAQIKPGAALTEDTAVLVALQQGIDRVVGGSITASSPSRYTLTVEVINPSDGRRLLTWPTEADSKEDVLKAVGRAAAKVRSTLGDPRADPSHVDETFTAASLDAAHAYVTAQDLRDAGKYEDALREYSKAVALDPTLGRAYAGLGAVSGSLGRREEAEGYYKQAIARLARMTPRERYRTRGGYYLTMHNPEKAREEYEALLKQFPADSSALTNLALTAFLRRDMTRALDLGRQASAIYPKNVLRLDNVALYALYAGDFAGAETTAASVLALNKDFVKAKLAIALSQLARARPRDAEASYRQMASMPGAGRDFGALGLADLALYEGRLSDAASIAAAARPTATSPTTAVRLAVTEAEAAALQGRLPEAARLAEDVLTASKEPGLAYLAGRVLTTSGRTARAQEVADTLSNQIDDDPQLYGRLLRGEIALERSDVRGALAAFQDAHKIADTWLGHFGLGRAYVLAEKFAEASTEFEWCEQHSGQAIAIMLDDIPTWRLMSTLRHFTARTLQGLKSPAGR